MPYTPNNPLIPGDPYSYDLKWMVKKIKEWKDPLDSAERAKSSEEAAAASAAEAANSASDAHSDALAANNSAAVAKNYANNIADPVNGIVTDWLADNITITPGVTIDTSLSVAGAAADAKATGDAVKEIDKKLLLNCFDLAPKFTGTSGTNHSVTFTKNADGTWNIVGTADATASRNLGYWVSSNPPTYPPEVIPGRKYFLRKTTTAAIQFYFYSNGNTISSLTVDNDSEVVFPPGMDGLMIRFRIAQGVTIAENGVSVHLYAAPAFDNNSVLNPTNDTTDRAPEINEILETYGVCKLAPGNFYISNIVMRAGTSLIGCGNVSKLKMLPNAVGSAIKISQFNSISDLTLSGSDVDIDVDPLGNRVGIEFSADYDGSAGLNTQSENCFISNVRIDNFDRAGLLCHNTSINYAKGLYVNNLYIRSCHIGLNIDYYSEFNKFVNMNIAWCNYACVNNGGNNNFDNCTFHATNTGFYIDGTQPNSGHGAMSNCTFCHIGSNTGRALMISKCTNGYIFSNCQFWYNSIVSSLSRGIVFTGCEFGRGATGQGMNISVVGGEVNLFNGCIFHNDVTYPPVFQITAGALARFANCYGDESGNLITG